MRFKEHLELVDKHAFLSPSNYHWVNYDYQKLTTRYTTAMAAKRGTDLHALAHEAIRLGVRFGRGHHSLTAYVNDAIGWKMTCEQPLFYSMNCFGTADTISFRKEKLRIHDLKTGVVKGSFKQLEVYAAIFCLEYGVDPYTIEILLRIYQKDEVLEHEPSPEVITEIMEKIVDFDNQIEHLRSLE